jgi:hypothetical protein
MKPQRNCAAAALCLLSVVVAQGCSDECAGLRCGCDYGSTVIVTAPGAAADLTVTADALMCRPIMDEMTRCYDTSDSPPRMA